MSVPSPEELRSIAAEIASAVGEEIGERRKAGFTWDTKSSTSDVVTEIDTWAEDEVVRLIEARRPDDGFLGEEGTSRTGTTGVRWIIDPVDGTTNLLYDLPGFGVSIAAELDGTVVAGAVHDPIRSEIFSASLAGGATRNGEPIRVSDKSDLETALVETGFDYLATHRAEQAHQLATILPAVRDIRRAGGAALGLCSVACGRVDAFYERGLSPWDSAAACVIATEAGGIVEDGGSTTERARTWAAGPHLADAFLALLESCGA